MNTVEFDVEREIDGIEQEIRQQPQLTDKQLADIRTICVRIRRACDAGDIDEARRAKALCMSIIFQGPPAPE